MSDWSDQELIAELTRRKNALHSIAAFRKFMEPSGLSDMAYPHARHHQVMAKAMEDVIFGRKKRVMVMCPPGSAKSTIARQATMLYWALNPTHQILRVSATTSLAERMARSLRSTLMEPDYYRLTGTKIDPNQQSVAAFANTKGGTMTSAGVGSSIVGLRADFALIDDPVASWEQAHSQTQREQMIQWYWSEYRSRLKPDAGEFLIMTRWHRFDAAGVILDTEGDDWHVIRMPLLADSPDDPVQREPQELLWKEWYTPKMVEEARRSPEIFSGLWQQTPLQKEGDFFAVEDFEIVDSAPEGINWYLGLDLAMTEKQTADATATVIGGLYDNTLYIQHVEEQRVTPDKTIQNLVDKHEKYNFSEILVEDSPAEVVFRNLCAKLLRDMGKYIPLMPMPTRGRDKTTRLQALRSMAKCGSVKIVRGDWNADFLRAMTNFPFGRHDDICDAAGLLALRASKMVNTAIPKSYTPPPPIEGAIAVGRDGQMVTTATLDELFEGYRPANGTIRI